MSKTTLRKYSITIWFDKPIPDLYGGDDKPFITVTASFRSLRGAYKYALQNAGIFKTIATPEKITITYATTSGIKMRTWFLVPEKEEE